jgi:hypothetical protein
VDAPVPTPKPEPTPEPAPRKAPASLRAVVADVAGRMFRRLATHHEKAARGDLKAWLDTGIREHSGVIAEAFGPVLALGRDMGLSLPAAPAVADDFIRRFDLGGTGPAVDSARFAAAFAAVLLPE